MRIGFTLLYSLILLFGTRLPARAVENQPRLAILAEPTLSRAGDLLSVELSQQTDVVLLERNEIDRILKEQRLALSGISVKDSIKIGQILGADGLLTLNTTHTGTNTYLIVTLIAVKQGVILDAMESPWPMKDAGEWAKLVRTHFQPLLPKLSVLPKDALPISILNLRSAANSPESKQLEHELTELLLNRLTHEKELFILERRKLDKLTTEKEFAKTEDSPFWNGSYLLEGIVDKNGFSREETTISARLVPPGGGAPMEIEVSGKRNLPEQLIEQLARHILESLRKQSSTPEWKPAAEAMQYYEEAKWALKWGSTKEAQAAIESAWALGKKDKDSAVIRLKAYIPEIPLDPGLYSHGGIYLETEVGDQESINQELAETSAKHPLRIAWERRGRAVRITSTRRSPNPEQIALALNILTLYDDFAKTLPANEPEIDSEWYQVGIEALNAASGVLRHFYFVPESQAGHAESLAELRAAARSVAERISQSPSVHDAYFAGSGMKTYDDLHRLSDNETNIYSCKLESGALWQEKPEDCVSLYRELISSAAFSYIHKDFLRRSLENPRIIVWHDQDRKHASILWTNFLNELRTSTNYFPRIEERFIAHADARNEAELEATFDALYRTILSNRQEIVSSSVEPCFLQGWNNQVMGPPESDTVTPVMEKLERKLRAEFQPQLNAMDQEFLSHARDVRKERKTDALFAEQKSFLESATSNAKDFAKVFSITEYSSNQAAVLLPLLATYKSNLVQQSAGKSSQEKTYADIAIARAGSVEWRLNSALRRRISNPHPTVQRVAAQARMSADAPRGATHQTTSPASIANALSISQFVDIPLQRLTRERVMDFKVFARKFRDGKLWLDLRFQEMAEDGNIIGFRSIFACWDFKACSWEFIPYPEHRGVRDHTAPGFAGEVHNDCYFDLFDGSLFLSEWGHIQKFDFGTRRWQPLSFPQQKYVQLFTIGGHLYAAGEESIFEILRDNSTHVLASPRRRPAVSKLDSLETFGKVMLFPGQENTIRASIGGSIYSWDGNDWTETLKKTFDKDPDVISEGVILRLAPTGRTAEIRFLPTNRSEAELCWKEEWKDSRIRIVGKPLVPAAEKNIHPIWESSDDLVLAKGPATGDKSRLYFLKVDNEKGRPEPRASVVCLDRSMTKPLILPLKFVPQNSLGQRNARELLAPEISWEVTHWMMMTDDFLLVGRVGMQGFWTIPKSELESALVAMKTSSRAMTATSLL